MKNRKNFSINRIILYTIIFGFISGIAFFMLKNNTDYSYYIKDFLVKSNEVKQNMVLSNALFIIIIYILSLSIIGIFLIYLLLFFASFAIGFTFALFTSYLKIKGLIFYILFFFESKFINFVLLFYFISVSTSFALRLLKAIFEKNERGIFKSFYNHFFRFIIVLVATIVNSLIIKYLLGDITIYLVSLL